MYGLSGKMAINAYFGRLAWAGIGSAKFFGVTKNSDFLAIPNGRRWRKKTLPHEISKPIT